MIVCELFVQHEQHLQNIIDNDNDEGEEIYHRTIQQNTQTTKLAMMVH